VAVDAPLFSALTYATANNWPVGSSVIVPLGKRKANAVILSENSTHIPTQVLNSKTFVVKDIESLDEKRPVLPSQYMRWLQWLADYYVHPIGQVVAMAFPPLEQKASNRKSKKSPAIKAAEISKPPVLTDEQTKCINDILAKPGFHSHLLFGVTGSGKTEVYLKVLEEILNKGQSGLVLVPEISLTPQLIQRFVSRFGDKVAVLHSHLTDRERTTQWWSMVEKEKRILVGARSALFCPIPDLGIVIVDEEHEGSYKQEEHLKYHARDAAIMLSKMTNIPIVLGSATPSLETWRHASEGKYSLHTLSQRVVSQKLPTVEIVDMRTQKELKAQSKNTDLPYWMSLELYSSMLDSLKKKEQIALFLNRRGFAPTVLCPDCGHVAQCPNCAISLTLHGRRDLVCHYCNYTAPHLPVCSSCKIGEVKTLGLGTEQVEEDVKKLFASARVSRADRDEVYSRETLEEMIRKMENHEIDILVGTQMIAKGLDFPQLNLVGIVLADVGFNLPDFRAPERSFQLITQVSGRAGRHLASGGRVIIQTFNPEYNGLQFAKTADYRAYAAHELQARKELHYPPYGRLASFRVIASDPKAGWSTAERLAHRCELLIEQNANYKKIQILGPVEAPLAKLRGKFRYFLLLKTTEPQLLSPFCRQVLSDNKWVPSATKVQVDIDPLNLL
jgi:primosomal protein N' (replication factor Y)